MGSVRGLTTRIICVVGQNHFFASAPWPKDVSGFSNSSPIKGEMLSQGIAKITKRPTGTNLITEFCMLGISECLLDPMMVTCFSLRGGLFR
jgi:hypothetical protein